MNSGAIEVLGCPPAVYDQMVALRRAFHRYPELAFKEVVTAKGIMAELDRLGIQYDYQGVGGGVIGRIRGDGDVVVALRAEMDALPGTENTGLPFSSANAKAMHACGHDAHMAMVLGAAALLAADPPPGQVMLIFQPAEERGGGARVILGSGVLAPVAAIFGGHVTHHYRVGEIMVASGVITAQSDGFVIRVKGRGGHGARPHETTDAVVIAGLLISVLQTLVSRRANPLFPGVLTIGKVVAGSAANVIAEEATLSGTIRTTVPEVRESLHDGLTRMSKALGDAHDVEVTVRIRAGYPPVVNTAAETAIARLAASHVVGEAGLATMEHPSMGAEDFSYYLEQLPGCYVRFGARLSGSESEYRPLHSPSFDIDEKVLGIGAAFFDRVARRAIEVLR